LLAVVLAVTVYVSRTAPFLAGDFLSDLAWKYSALLSLPLARLVLAIPNGCVDLGDYPHASEP